VYGEYYARHVNDSIKFFVVFRSEMSPRGVSESLKAVLAGRRTGSLFHREFGVCGVIRWPHVQRRANSERRL